MNITLDTLADINLDMAVKVGFEKAKVDFSERAQAQIANSREAFERMLTSEDAGFVYGSTVAPGARAKKRLNEDNRKSLASTANAWAPKTFGGGNNYVPESAARLVLLGSALNLNIHFHILFLDGVYVYRDNRPPRFQRVKAPNKDELVDLVQLISQRVGRCLQRQGLLEQDTESAWLELQPADDTDAMPHLLGSSVSYRIAVGPQQGRKAFMIRTIRPLDRPDAGLERVAKANGFSLHAGVSCEGHQKDKRERLCRYIARPAVAVPRLSLSSTGKVVYSLKTPYRDGTTQVAFDGAAIRPVDFMARLAALVPKPRVNLTRYHGVLAPNHRWRGEVTPAKRGKGVKRIANTEVRSPAERHVARACPALSGMSWAQRLKRVFNIDIAVCGRCGGSVRVIACIEDQDIIDRILAHLESKEQNTPALPHLAPPTRASPKSLPLFAGKDSSSTALNQQGSH